MATYVSLPEPLPDFGDSKDMVSVRIRALSETSSDDFDLHDSSRPSSRGCIMEARMEKISHLAERTARNSSEKVSLTRFFDHVTGHHKELEELSREAQLYKDGLEEARLDLRREVNGHINTKESLASVQRMNEKLKYDLAGLRQVEDHKNTLQTQMKAATEQIALTETKLQRARDMYSSEHRKITQERERLGREKSQLEQQAKLHVSKIKDLERAIASERSEGVRSRDCLKKSEQETKNFRARVELLEKTVEQLLAGKSELEAQVIHFKTELDTARSHVCLPPPTKRSPARGRKGDISIQWIMYDDKMIPENEYVQYHADRWFSSCVDVKAYTWDLVAEQAVDTENGFYVDLRALGVSADDWTKKTMTVAYKVGDNDEVCFASAQRYSYLKLARKPRADERSALLPGVSQPAQGQAENETPCRKAAFWWLLSTTIAVAVTLKGWVPFRV